MPRDTPVLFTFPYPPYGHQFPTSVQVTGNFDEWQRKCYLHKNDLLNRFEAEVQIDLERLALVKDEHVEENMKRKVVFKYVLDGHNWITDPDQDQERDYEGNLNNIRFLQDVTAAERESHEKNEEIEEHVNEMIEVSGDAMPSQNGSVVPSNNHHTTVNGDEHDGDGDYGVVLLQGEPVTVSPRNNGDAHPSADESAMPATTSSASLETAITTATTTTALAPSLSSSCPTSNHISTAPSSVTSIEASLPATSDHSNNAPSPHSHHNLFHRKSMTVTPSAPTTAISTSAPAFPSTNTLSNVSSKTEKRKTGFWKKLKKAFS